MAVVFMAFRAQLQIDLLLLISMLISGCFSKSDLQKASPIPEKWASPSDSGWVESQGILFLNGTPYSGWQLELNQAGDTLFQGGFVEGHRQGLHKTINPEGQLLEIRRFIDGRQDGLGQRWFDNGTRAFEANYSQDHYEGLVQSWFENGQQHERFHYENGKEEGRQQRWDEQGNVLANYEVRNGRKYGLSGTKNCVSPSSADSLVRNLQ